MGEEEMHTIFFFKPEGRYHLEYLGIYVKIVLKWMLEKYIINMLSVLN
jgi:hypothetical protein